MRFVLDTSAWYAYISTPDIQHSEAKSVIKQKPSLSVPYPVFEELVALTHKRQGKAIALKGVGKLLLSNAVDIIYISPADNQEIWELYQSYPNWLDYVDASVIWLSRKLDLPIFTFDRHLRQLDLSVIPVPTLEAVLEPQPKSPHPKPAHLG